MDSICKDSIYELPLESDSLSIYEKHELILGSFNHVKGFSKLEMIEKFLGDILELIPEAENSSYYEIEGSSYVHICSKGYDESQLSKMPDRIEEIMTGYEVEMTSKDMRHSRHQAQSYNRTECGAPEILTSRASHENHTTLYAPINAYESNIGVLCVDSYKGCSFSALSKKTLKYYAQFMSCQLEHMINQDRVGQIHVELIQALISSIEVNDPYTEGHGKRVGYYAKRLGDFLGLPRASVSELETAGLLHDIGKIGIPTDILNKKGKLLLEEYLIVQKHPANTKKILEKIQGLSRISEFTYCHHEQYDGSGYPRGLKGEEIPYEGRILSVADAFDAMTSHRAYREAMTASEAAEFILSQSGKQFDPELSTVAAMLLPILHHMLTHGEVEEMCFDLGIYERITSL